MNANRPSRPNRRWPLAAALALSYPALAMWAMPTDAPVSRLAANVGKYVSEHPEDPQGRYILGRIHGLAFTMRTRTVSVWERDRDGNAALPDVTTDDFQAGRFRWGDEKVDEPTREELVHHLTEAVRHAEAAVTMLPGHDAYNLSLACILETGTVMADLAGVVPAAPTDVSDQERKRFEELVTQLGGEREGERSRALAALRAELPRAVGVIHEHRGDPSPARRDAVRDLLQEHWRERAIAAYFTAYEKAIKGNLAIDEQPMRGLGTLIGYEAGTSYVRLVRARGVRGEEDRRRLARVEADIRTLEAKPDNMAITPIIFSLEGPAPLADLLDGGLTARFDLDGDGRVEAWPWVRPTTGILVWDPKGEGRITSGRQLFGSVTWWMFFEDGYHALDALDDNRDGEVAGGELAGLAVWFDLDSDGVSGPGEVVPVGRLGIEAISARATGRDGRSPCNTSGLRLRDGRVLPTYDWVVSPVPGASEADGCAGREPAA